MKPEDMTDDELIVEEANCRDERRYETVVREIVERYKVLVRRIEVEAKRVRVIGSINT